MIVKEYIITAKEGLHARPAAKLIKLAKKFKSVSKLTQGEKTVKLNSMFNILSLGLKGGTTISILIEGEDELEANEAMSKFFLEELQTF